MNSIPRGWCQTAEEWAWSGARWYVGEAIGPIQMERPPERPTRAERGRNAGVVEARESLLANSRPSGVPLDRATPPYGRTYIEIWNAGTSSWDRDSQSAYGNPFMWTGQRYDAGTGLYHFMYRSYSPELGSWLQRDPLGYADGTSLYQYVLSNPILWIDALGLKIRVAEPRINPDAPDHGQSEDSYVAETEKLIDEVRNSKNADGSPTHAAEDIKALDDSPEETVVVPTNDTPSPGQKVKAETIPADADDAQNGKGSKSKIYIDPFAKYPYDDGTPRDPACTLGHEACHARTNLEGRNRGPENAQDEELAGIGTENELRRSKGLKPRERYGPHPVQPDLKPPKHPGGPKCPENKPK